MVEKRTQKEGLRNKLQRKYLGFLYIHQFKKRKKRGTGHSKQFEGMQREATF